MEKDKKLTFEEALEGLEKSATDLIKDGITLEEAISNFEKGMDYYNKCNEILENAKQKIYGCDGQQWRGQ